MNSWGRSASGSRRRDPRTGREPPRGRRRFPSRERGRTGGGPGVHRLGVQHRSLRCRFPPGLTMSAAHARVGTRVLARGRGEQPEETDSVETDAALRGRCTPGPPPVRRAFPTRKPATAPRRLPPSARVTAGARRRNTAPSPTHAAAQIVKSVSNESESAIGWQDVLYEVRPDTPSTRPSHEGHAATVRSGSSTNCTGLRASDWSLRLECESRATGVPDGQRLGVREPPLGSLTAKGPSPVG